MKFKVGDQVLVTAGKDKGKTGEISRVLPSKNAVIVSGMNEYTKHVRPFGGRSGDKVKRERPLSAAKIAVINDKGQPDRIAINMSKAGEKTRVFAKTGKPVEKGVKKVKEAKKSKK